MVDLVEKMLVPEIDLYASEVGIPIDGQHQDAWGKDLRKTINQIEIEYGRIVSESEAELIAENMAARVEGTNSKLFKRQFKSLSGVELVGSAGIIPAKTLNAFVDANVSLIESISKEYIGKVHKSVSNAIRSGQRAESFQKTIKGVLDKNVKNAEARSALIARDQISKLNGQITKDRHKDLGVKGYYWRTSGDDRVRQSHEEKEGNYYTWDNPPADTGHPGDDFQCRCWAEPAIRSLFNESDLLAA